MLVEGDVDESTQEFVRTEFDRIMLTCDFSVSHESHMPWAQSVEYIMEEALCLLDRVVKWEDAKRILTMFQLKHESLGNADDYVPAPYSEKVSILTLTGFSMVRVIRNVVRLTDMEEELVRQNLSSI